MTVASPRKTASITEKVFQRVYSNFNLTATATTATTTTSYGGTTHHHHHIKKSSSFENFEEDYYDEEEDGTMELAQMGADRAKNVLILMSDTGGGHRASAEAIRDAFKIEFGDEYNVRTLYIYKYILFLKRKIHVMSLVLEFSSGIQCCWKYLFWVCFDLI